MPNSNGVGPISPSFGSGGISIASLDLAVCYLFNKCTVDGSNHVTAIQDQSKSNKNATKSGPGNLVFNAADAHLNGQASCIGATDTYLDAAAAVVAPGAPRTVMFWGWSNDNIGAKFCQFGAGTLIQCMFEVIAGNTYTYTDDVAKDNHYAVPAADVTALQAVALLMQITIGAPMTFQKNGVSKAMAGDNIISEVGNGFWFGGGLGAFWAGGGLGGIAVANTYGLREQAFFKQQSAKFGIAV